MITDPESAGRCNGEARAAELHVENTRGFSPSGAGRAGTGGSDGRNSRQREQERHMINRIAMHLRSSSSSLRCPGFFELSSMSSATPRVLGAYLFVNRLESEVFTVFNKIVQSYKFGIEVRVHVE